MKPTILLLLGLFSGIAFTHLYYASKVRKQEPLEKQELLKMKMDELNDLLNVCIEQKDWTNADLIVDHIEQRKTLKQPA